jgi:hypothetical protein
MVIWNWKTNIIESLRFQKIFCLGFFSFCSCILKTSKICFFICNYNFHSQSLRPLHLSIHNIFYFLKKHLSNDITNRSNERQMDSNQPLQVFYDYGIDIGILVETKLGVKNIFVQHYNNFFNQMIINIPLPFIHPILTILC